MGGGMAQLFAENGIEVSLEDPSEVAMDGIIELAKKQGFGDKLKKYADYKSLCQSLGSPKVFVFSLPHGTVGDGVLGGLMPYLSKGDIIIDAGNEHWENTERRQGKCVTKGIRYIGMGVSGGYQAARAGPSMCPGADDESLDLVMPMLKKVAAKDKNGNSCVGKAGTGGSGHYVKMIHNGIEHGMMSAIAEAWQVMNVGLNMSYDEIGGVFTKWNDEGPFRGTFLISIGAEICKARDKSGDQVLGTVEDKVVQDLTGEEGTGIRSNEEAIRQHVSAPTLNVAHALRLASAFRGQRIRAKQTMGAEFPPQKFDISPKQKDEFVKDLEQATYLACLASYIQGINVIEAADRENKWNINYEAVLQIWRAGCIIQADHIAEILEPIFARYQDKDTMNMLFEPSVANEIKLGMANLRNVIVQAVTKDHIVPALSASLEYLKYQVNTGKRRSFSTENLC
jgi:6-phosphogluconate dehydrogenase